MARRRRSKKDNGGDIIFQIMVCIFLPIFLLLNSKNPTLKGIGGVLLFIVVIMYAGFSSGLSGEEMGPFLLIVFVLCIILGGIFANQKTKGNEESVETDDGDSYTFKNGNSIKTAKLKKVDAKAEPSVLPKVHIARPFEELLNEMEIEIESVTGLKLRTESNKAESIKVVAQSEQKTTNEEKKTTGKTVSDTPKVKLKTLDDAPENGNAKEKNDLVQNEHSEKKEKKKTVSVEKPLKSSSTDKTASKLTIKTAEIKKSGTNNAKEPIATTFIKKTTKEPTAPILPKIVISDLEEKEEQCEVNVSGSTEFPYMNAPVTDQEEPKTDKQECTKSLAKDEFYYDSVVEAVTLFNIPNGYKKIMINRIENTDICECPALVWTHQEYLKMLPLIRNAHVFQWPLKSIPLIIAERRYNPDYDNEYLKISGAELGKEFSEVFPEYPYSNKGVYTDVFSLPVGVSVTNTSAKILFNILKAELYLDDDVTRSSQYVPAVKEIYKKHYLYENHILSLEEYNSIKDEILEAFLETERSDNVYREQIKYLQMLQL